jgi:hypothetical protein
MSKVCSPGKRLNPATGRCIKEKPKRECPPGKVLNLATNRCITEKKPRGVSISVPKPVSEPTDFSTKQVDDMVDKYINIGRTQEMTQKYGGYVFFHDLYILYLLKKYRYTCYSIAGARLPNGVIITPVIYADPNIYPSDEEKMDFVDITYRCIVEKKNDVIVIPLIISEDPSSTETHFNVLVYRRKEHQMELFEPHGAIYRADFDKSSVIWRNLDKYMDALNEKLTKEFKMEPIKLLISSDVCPVLHGMQFKEEQGRPLLILQKKATRTEYEPSGFCTIWGLFFIELVLKNPHVPSKDLIMGVLDKVSARDMVNIARGYMITVCNKLQQYYSAMLGKKVNTTALIASYLFNDGDDNLTRNAINAALTQIVESERYLETININTNNSDKIYNEHIADKIESLTKLVDNPYKYSELERKTHVYLYNYYTNQHKFVTPSPVKKDRTPSPVKKDRTPSPVKKDRTPSPVKKDRTPSPVKKDRTPSPVKKERTRKTVKCPPGKELNPKTNRCKTVKLKTCPPGKVLNPVTNRCNKIK